MIHTLKYVNNLGQSIVFGGESPKDRDDTPWTFGETDLFDIEQDCVTVGDTIVGFDSGTRKASLDIFMTRGTEEDRRYLVDVTSYDKRIGVPGTLYAGKSYMRCWIKDIKFDDWQYYDGMLTGHAVVTSDNFVWVRKESIVLAATVGQTSGGLNYPHNYPHNYGYASGTSRIIKNPFMLPAKLDITFPGPCADPYVIIAGNRYQVTASATKGQLIIVRGYPQEGSKKQILLRDANGSERSILSEGTREENAQIFAEMPVGDSVAAWTGGYNINVDMYEERLSPW